jgi:Fic family protein
VPAPPTHTEALMGDLETFINSEEARALPPVIVNAVIHYQSETIHPFPDGNGRVGRLLLPVILASESVMPMPLLYISPFIEKHKDEYDDAILAVSKTGAWEEWVRFFAQAIEMSAIETMRKIDEIAQLRDQFAKEVQQARASAFSRPSSILCSTNLPSQCRKLQLGSVSLMQQLSTTSIS